MSNFVLAERNTELFETNEYTQIELKPEDHYLLWAISIIICLAEVVAKEQADCPWLSSVNLLKRREAYEIDRHVQGMLLSVGKIREFTAKEIECGNKSFYRTEFSTTSGYILHVFHRNDTPKSEYRKEYCRMNQGITNIADAKYMYLAYNLDKERKLITELWAIIPNGDGESLISKEINLPSIRQALERLENVKKETIMQLLKELSEERNGLLKIEG